MREGVASERLTSTGNSTAPCLSDRRDLGPHKQFQRQGKIVANRQLHCWGRLYTHKLYTCMIIHAQNPQTHTLALVLHSVFLWGNCWFQTGSIKDETTFALVSLWCSETYLQPVLLVTACIDMRHAQCSVLAGKTTMCFSHVSPLWTNRRTLASNRSAVWDMCV